MNSNAPAKPAGYTVAKAQGRCVICTRDVVPGEKIMAAVRETPVAFERLDVCPACWPAFDKAGLLGFWQTIMPQPNARKKIFVDDEVLCELFERLADVTETAKINFRFVLGLILMRKRRLVFESSRVENDRDIWTVRFRGGEHFLPLLNPKLDENQIAEVSTQLGDILSADL